MAELSNYHRDDMTCKTGNIYHLALKQKFADTMRYHVTPVSVAIIKKTDSNKYQ